MDVFERELGNLPPLPPRPAIAFRCRDCVCVWTFGIESPISFQRFYERNKTCPSCGNSNIEIEFIRIGPISIE